MLARLRSLKLALTLSALLTLYLTLTVVQQVQDPSPASAAGVSGGIKEVVAYSLRKQIEVESEEVICEGSGGVVDAAVDTKGAWTRVPDTDLFVFGVYYDDRLEPFRYLRVLGMIKGTWNQTIYCQTASSNKLHVTKASRTEIWYKEWDVGEEDTFNPVLLSCYLPPGAKPSRLSLNVNPCDFSGTTFKMTPTIPTKRRKNYSMTVCVKPLDFTQDISTRLMQWIEINKILGADRFEFFVRKISGKTGELLEFYRRKHRRSFLVKRYQNVEEFHQEDSSGGNTARKTGSRRGSGLITRQAPPVSNGVAGQEESSGSVKKKQQGRDVGIGRVTVEIAEASSRKIWQKRRNELMAYNDCLYRNLRSSHFVIPVDIDEIIVPKRFYTWGDALGHLLASAPHLEDEYASFSAPNAYFLEDFATKSRRSQETAFFFEFGERSEFSEEGESGKSFVSTKNALTVFNHYALDALKPGIRRTFFLPRELVQMNHYKRTCSVNLLPQCAKYLSSPVRIVDTVINKYKAEFVENYEKTVSEFKVFSKKRTFNKHVKTYW